MPTKSKAHENACVAAYVAGWQQYGGGDWYRLGTADDTVTCHPLDDEGGVREDCPQYGYVVASTPERALQIDRETFSGRAA